MRQDTFSRKLAIPIDEGYLIADYQDVIRCSAQGNYTEIYMRGGRCVRLNKHLKTLEQLLPPMFFRVHQSHLVNLDHVQMWLAKEKNALCLSDGSEVQVARTRRKDLISRLRFIK
jgi:two-component system LytT family response regulator